MATLSNGGNKNETIRMVVAAAITTLAVIMLLALSGCKTTKVVYVPQVEYRDSVVYRDRTQHDSIYIYQRDSLSVVTRHDTCFIERWKTVYKDKLVIRTDTVRETEIKIETKTEVVEVEKKLTRLQEWQLRSFWLWFLFVLGIVAAVVVSVLRKIIKK